MIKGSKYRHRKRGTTYEFVGTAKVQTDVPLNDMDEVVVYVSEADGMTMWVRRRSEFYDGRFEEIDP